MRLIAQSMIGFGVLVLGHALPVRADDSRPELSALITRAHELHLSDEREWRLLLHDRRNWWGRYQSDIDGPGFFLSPQGRRNPWAELDATLTAFAEPSIPVTDTDTLHAQCHYPARYTWLNEQLHFDPAVIAPQACPRLDAWKANLKAQSVTMVFASYYMNNPASMYGHPFLQLGAYPARDPRNVTSPLLDYSVSFAADVTTASGLLYTVYGLTGGYRGQYSTTPYYMKAQEYNNMESRDLWEYSLNLDTAAVDRMIDHLWELGHTSMAYYFFNKNCAYQLLPLIDAANPSLHLADPFHFKAIPTDSLRAVLRPEGLVTHIVLRPSHVTQMLARRSQLNSQQIRFAESWAKKGTAPTDPQWLTLSTEEKAKVLDSAYDLFRYRGGFDRVQSLAFQDEERRLLLARNALKVISSSAPVVTPVSPDQGHGTGRVGAAYGFTRRSHFEELDLRPGVHDQDDPSPGYLPGSQMQMFHTRLRYDDDRKTAYLQQLSLVDIQSFTPWDRWVHHPSWKINTGAEVANDLDKDAENSLYYRLNGGSGFAFPTPLSRGSMVYAMAEADAGTGHVFQDGYRLGGGGCAGLLFSIAQVWRVHLETSYLYYPLGRSPSKNVFSCVQSFSLAHSVEGRVTLERQNHYEEVLVSALWYL